MDAEVAAALLPHGRRVGSVGGGASAERGIGVSCGAAASIASVTISGFSTGVFATIDNLIDVLEGCGVPWNVNGYRGQRGAGGPGLDGGGRAARERGRRRQVELELFEAVRLQRRKATGQEQLARRRCRRNSISSGRRTTVCPDDT